jgi:hypothetical protein
MMLRLIYAPMALVAISFAWVAIGSPRTLADERDNPDAAGPAVAADAPSAEDRIRQALDARTSLSAKEATLDDVLAQLREQTKATVILDHRSLQDVGLAGDAPFSLLGELNDISWKSLLNLFLGALELTWTIDDGALIITTPEVAEARLLTRVYNVADLVSVEIEGRVHYDHDSLINVIEMVVHPETWDTVGGPASVEPFRETLIVAQTAITHDEIESLLDSLREGRRLADGEPAGSPPKLSIRPAGVEPRLLAALEKPVSLNLDKSPLADLPRAPEGRNGRAGDDRPCGAGQCGTFRRNDGFALCSRDAGAASAEPLAAAAGPDDDGGQ